MNTASPHISIVIPAYNEAEVIADTLHVISDFVSAKNLDAEIILSDDGSTDNTADTAESLELDNLRILRLTHAGKGHAVKEGIKNAHGNLIIFTDADLSTPIEEAERLLHELENGTPVVIGSRRIDGLPAEHRQPRIRHFAGNIFATIVKALLIPGIHDPQCGFKGFQADSIRNIISKSCINGFAFDTEILMIARKLRIPVKEIPVIWRDSGNSSVKLMRDGPKMLADLIRIYIHLRSL
jgi:dolichyl-phosphate beta-glucosyltransferase